MRRHGVGRDNPTSLSQLMCNGELIVYFTLRGVKAACNEGKPAASMLGHDDETKLFKISRQVVSCAREVALGSLVKSKKYV